MTGIFLPKIQWFFIELTNNCNAACSHCPSKLIRRKREYMPIGTAKRIIEEIAAYKRNNPEYQGYVKLERAVFLHVFGEPMLHPDLFDIIQHGGSKGIEFCLVTNGTLLDESNIERVLNSKLSFITISINADDKVVFESNHPGCDFDDYMATVKEFIKEVKLRKLEALKVELQFLVEKGALGHARHGLSITKETVKGIILQWRKFVSDLDRKRTALKINFDPYWNDLEKFLAPGNDQIEYRQAIDKNICILLKSTCNYGNAIIERGKKVVKAFKGICPFGCPFNQLCFFSDGSVSYCTLDYNNSVDLGNINKNSLETIWASEHLQNVRREMLKKNLSDELCRKCRGTVTDDDG